METKSLEKKIITRPLPHEPWPPPANNDELAQLAMQRNIDIGIKGKSGPIREFENQFLTFLEKQVEYAVTFNSGTSGLLAAYFAIEIEEGDEVLGPGLTYHAALSPVYMLKGNVKLVDIDSTRCIDPEKIESNLSEKTRAITVVHQWGHPADMDRIMDIASKHNLRVIEDCSHAHGSRYKGKLCGTFGDIAVFSLQTNKAVFAGEGGILVTNHKKYYDRAVLLGHYRDRCREEIKDETLHEYWPSGFGLKLRMSPFNAIVAKHSLAKFPLIKESRKRCLTYFNERLNEVDYLAPVYISHEVDMGAWYGFKPLYLPEKLGISREKLIELLRLEGMEVSAPSGETLAKLPLYKDFPDQMFKKRKEKFQNDIEDLPVCTLVEERALSLPAFYNWESDKELIDQYIEVFKLIKYKVKSDEKFTS